MEFEQSPLGPQPAQDPADTRILHRQCGWCGMRLSGPLAGQRVLDKEGHVIQLDGYTTWICDDCTQALVAWQ